MKHLIKKRNQAGQPGLYPEGRWLLVAIGDRGDSLDWKEGYEVLGEVRFLLGLLEEFGKEKADLGGQLAGLPFFEGLAACSFPPLYRESDLDSVAFLKHEESLGWREYREPGFSAAEVRVYVWSSRRKELLSQARVLAARLATTLEELETAARISRKKPGRCTPTAARKRIQKPTLNQADNR